jgi:hypothetical protein
MEKSAVPCAERRSHTVTSGAYLVIWVIITVVIFLDRREELALLRQELKRQGFGC